MSGFQESLLAKADGKMTGLQLGVLTWADSDAEGVQGSWFSYCRGGMTGVQVGFVNIAGDLRFEQHLHSHLHISEAQKQEAPNSMPSVAARQKSVVDPRCQRLLEQHEERTREWKKRFPGLN